MDVEQIREYCLSLDDNVEECMPFDDTSLVFKTSVKMFALVDIETGWTALKCDPEYALELRENFDYVTPAYHFNKKHWNGIDTERAPGADIRKWIADSFSLVKKKAKKSK